MVLIGFIVDNKLLKLNIQNTDDLKTALQTVWTDIFNDIIEKLFGSTSTSDQSKRFFLSFIIISFFCNLFKDFFEINT